MNYSELCTADTALLGTGRGGCGKVLGYDRRFFLAKPDFSFANSDAAKLEANWSAGIEGKNLFPFPEVMELESQNTEATFYETPSGATFKTKKEKRKTQFKFIENIALHASMKSYDGGDWKVFFYTEKGYLRGHTNADGTIEGLPLSQFYVNAQETATIDSNPEQSPVVMEFNDVDDWDKEYFVATPESGFLGAIEGVYELELRPAVGTAGATIVFVMDVVTKAGNVGVDGLLLTDLELKDAAGNVVVIDSATPDGSIAGRYTITATDIMTSGTIRIKDVVTKVDVYYQSQSAAVTSA